MSFPRASPCHTGSHTLSATALSGGSTAYTGTPPGGSGPRAGGEGACPGAALLRFAPATSLCSDASWSLLLPPPHTLTPRPQQGAGCTPAVCFPLEAKPWAPRSASGSLCPAGVAGHSAALNCQVLFSPGPAVSPSNGVSLEKPTTSHRMCICLTHWWPGHTCSRTQGSGACRGASSRPLSRVLCSPGLGRSFQNSLCQ